MAESTVLKPDGQLDPPAPTTNGSSTISSSSIIHRRIEFHLARKPFNGFVNGGGDFRLETLNPGSDSQRPAPNPGQSVKGPRRPDGSEFLENGLDPELCLGITVRKIGAGLQNLGNTCFLNSVLQCLTHTEPLAAYLQSGKHQNSCKVAGFCALCAIQKHVSRALQSTGRILAPKDLVSNLRCISRTFRNSRQEDAHEYMVNLLESMHKCCLPSGVPSESPSAYDKSLVHKIFGGRLRSQVKCMQCNYCSNTFDPFLDLSLEIAKADSLQKALVNFTAAEQLDGGERQYQCQKCKHKVRALKQLTVHKAPYVLTIHLKRFRAHNLGQKIDKKVQFGPTLDLKPFVSGSYEGDLKYTLYGVLVHCGFSTHSGHYYSFVRTSGGTWYNLDDNRVAAVGERTVLEQKAYMLFYVRDRRNSVPRKSVDAVQKENMKGNNGGNKAVFSFKQGYSAPVQNGIVENRSNGVANVGSAKISCNGLVPNGTVENKSNGMACSSALTQNGTKDALMNGSTKQGSNGLVQHRIVENGTNGVVSSAAVAKKDEVNIGSTKQGHNGSVQSASVDNRSNGAAGSGALTQKDALSVGSAKKLPPQNNDLILAEHLMSKKDSVAATDSKTPEEPSSGPSSGAASSKETMTGPSLDKLRVDGMVTTASATSKKNMLVSVEVLPNSNNPSNSKINKLPSEKTSQKSKPVSGVGAPILVPSLVPSDKTMEKIHPVRSPDQPNCDNSPAGLLNEKVSDVSMEQSGSFVMTNGISNKEARSSKPKRKIRKQIQRRPVVSMHLGTNILFGGLSLRKKFKKSKRPGLDSKNLSKEQMLASSCISSDLGPSTSGKTEKTSLHATRAKKRAAKSRSKRVDSAASAAAAEATNSFGGSMTDDEKCRDQIGQNGAVLGADKQSEKASSSSVAQNQSDDRETIQNGTVCLITGGLDETYVPRWDETDLPTSRIAQSKSSENISIGYVGDEWDEEYDMGRRKKVRTFKHAFGGPNVFQEIASKKMHSNKKPRMDQSSSANQPFRI